MMLGPLLIDRVKFYMDWLPAYGAFFALTVDINLTYNIYLHNENTDVFHIK